MVSLRPHVLRWTTPDGPPAQDDNGYDIPGEPGTSKEVPCRFHSGGGQLVVKTFLLDDGTTTQQKGTIRLDAGVELPDRSQQIEVVDGSTVVFSGKVMDVFRGQLSHRIDV